MRYMTVGLIMLIITFASFTPVYGAEHFGIQVYKGARLDPEEMAFIKKSMGADGYFYRTGDSVEKVTAFYRKHPGLTSLGDDKNGGRFIKDEGGHTIYIVIDNPWQPSKGGEVNTDTKILIMKE